MTVVQVSLKSYFIGKQIAIAFKTSDSREYIFTRSFRKNISQHFGLHCYMNCMYFYLIFFFFFVEIILINIHAHIHTHRKGNDTKVPDARQVWNT